MISVLGAQGGNIQSDLPLTWGAIGRRQGRERAQNAPFSHVLVLHISISGKIKHVWQALDPKGGRNCLPLWARMAATRGVGDSLGRTRARRAKKMRYLND
jgi:hypothetical protein